MWSWIKSKLGIQEINQRLDHVESRVSHVESRVSEFEVYINNYLVDFGDYKWQTKKDLRSMKIEIEKMMNIATNLMEGSQSDEWKQRARKLVSRLKNHNTRIQNEIASKRR